MSAALERAIERAIGGGARVRRMQSVGGGCISAAHRVELDDGRTVFVKSNSEAPAEMFEREAEGLEALARAEALRVPATVAAGTFAGLPLIVIEQIDTGLTDASFSERLGRGLAQLHQRMTSTRNGFDHDNYVGSTPQPNGWDESWPRFFAQQRLAHQLDLARAQGLCDGRMSRLGDRLIERLGDLIGAGHDPACLIHGDLWSGNVLCDSDAQPVLIDPAAYYGQREAELAMTQLFGGFDGRFYRSYEECWPLQPGSTERMEIYKLYHLLNHLNLFGSSYRSQCLAILQRFGG